MTSVVLFRDCMKLRIYYTQPSITELEVRYARDAAAHGWGDHGYDYITCYQAIIS